MQTSRGKRPIYGSAKKEPCVYKVPTTLDINTYLSALQQVMASLATYNNKTAAIESIQIIENNIDRALS